MLLTRRSRSLPINELHVVFWIFLGLESTYCIVHPDGISKVSRYQDDLGNYDFAYTVANNEGEHFHKAGKDALGRVVGSYGLTEVDGRHRIVDYVADHEGFRAHVRSNEPGVVSSKSAAVTVEKSGSDNVAHGLDFAASSDSGINFGDRLKEMTSRVTYSRPREDEEHHAIRRLRRPVEPDVDRLTADGRRRQNRRLSAGRTPAVSLETRPENLPDISDSRAALYNADASSYSRYQPPIDPFGSGRQQLIPPPVNPIIPHSTRERDPEFSTPPYGGIETRNPLLDPTSFGRYPSVTQYPSRNEVTRVPVVSMSTIHGGIGDMPYLLNPTAPQPSLLPRNGYYPRGSSNSEQDFRESNYGRLPPPSTNTRSGTFDNRRRPPDLVLRAVAIPNGIQAVHVNPETGEVYNSPEFAVYDPRDDKYANDDDDGPSDLISYDRNEENLRNPNNNFRSSPFQGNRFPPFRPSAPRDIKAPSYRNYSHNSGYNYRNHRGLPDETSLSRPSAKDLDVISRIFDNVNRRHNVRHPINAHNARYPVHSHTQTPNNVPYVHDSRPDYPRNAVYPENDDYRFPVYRNEFSSPIGPRDLASIFPLTFGNRHSPDSDYPLFDEPAYGSRAYRSVQDPNSQENISEKPALTTRNSKP